MSKDILNKSVVIQKYYYCEQKVDSLEQLIFVDFNECYGLPILSLVGFALNMMSLAILKRSGLHKPCNILLFSLVVADSMCLVSFFDFGHILHYYGPNKPYPNKCGFQYEMSLNAFLFYISELFSFLGNWGQYVNTTVPVFITLERILAVFMPITFRSIVTKKTAIVVVLLCFVFWLPWSLTVVSLTSFVAKKLQQNVTVVFISSQFYRYPVLLIIESYVLDTLASWFPLTVITIGCSAVAIKVNVALKRRRAMTSAEKLTWSPRTTATLLVTCCIFATTHAASSMFMYLFPINDGSNVLFRSETMCLLYAINASSNFFVYISSNQKLYKIFLDLMRCK